MGTGCNLERIVLLGGWGEAALLDVGVDLLRIILLGG